MPLPGPHVHQQLITAYAGAARNLEQLRGEMTKIDTQRDALEDSRDQALSKLAEHYLPELTPEAIANTWSSVRPTMREILLRKQNKVRERSEDLEDQNRILHGQEDALTKVTQRLDEAEQTQDSIAEKVKERLSSDAGFVDLSDRAAMAEVALERAEANLNEVSQDAARKLPAYDECKLFTYLKDRNFGTPEYTHRGFTRRMDRMVAKTIDFVKSKQSYDYLTRTPDVMRKIIAEDRAALDTVLAQLQDQRDAAAQECGLIEQIKVVESLQQERVNAIELLSVTSDQCEHLQAELNDLEDGRCGFYQEAIDLFRSMLSRTDSSELRQEARRTADITDDQIVASLRGIESQMQETDVTEHKFEDGLRRAQAIHESVGRLIQRFRASGFDRSRCQFADTLDVAMHLDRLRGPHDVDDLWNSIRRAQSWGPTTMDKLTNVATHPMTQVLVSAMAQAAGAAMSDHARRAGRRSRRRW